MYRIHGAAYFVLGALLPAEHKAPTFASKYFYDPETELQTRLSNCGIGTEKMIAIMSRLQAMMHKCSPIVQDFKTVIQRIREEPVHGEHRFVLSSNYNAEGAHKGTYNLPRSGEVAALMPLQSSLAPNERPAESSFVLQCRGGEVKELKATHPLCDAMHYVLF